MKIPRSITVAAARKKNALILFVLLISFILLVRFSSAQTRMSVLEIPKKGSFEMPEDTLEIDELIMHDSATLILSKASANSFIKARKVSIASNCKIIGTGAAGKKGEKGRDALPPIGACNNGLQGETGLNGSDGERGKDFILDTDQMEVTASLVINLAGGMAVMVAQRELEAVEAGQLYAARVMVVKEVRGEMEKTEGMEAP